MKRPTLPVAIALLGATFYLWAANPWEEKPWGEWSQAEVNKVLQDSPWARRTSMRTAGGKPEYVVQWASSATIRQAWARDAQLNGGADAETINKYVSGDTPNVEIHIQPYAFGAFVAGPRDIPCGPPVFLRPDSRKEGVPMLPQINFHGDDQGRMMRVELNFPREVEKQPLITPQDKKVTFSCGAGDALIRVEFDLSKMTRDRKPDL